MSELEEIVNAPEMVQAFGRSYEIKRFTLGPLCQSFEYVGPLGFVLKKLMSYPRNEKGVPVLVMEDMMDVASIAMSVSGPSVMGLISVATKEPVQWLDEQDPLDGLHIFAKVVEKNLDFFTPQYIEKLRGLFGGLMDRIPTLGGEQSTS